MFLVMWEFEVPPPNRDRFEEVYGPGGPWVALFAGDAAYLGTELVRNGAREGRYMTIDRWASREARDRFMNAHAVAYRHLDELCGSLTSEERHVGDYDVADDVPAREQA